MISNIIKTFHKLRGFICTYFVLSKFLLNKIHLTKKHADLILHAFSPSSFVFTFCFAAYYFTFTLEALLTFPAASVAVMLRMVSFFCLVIAALNFPLWSALAVPMTFLPTLMVMVA